MYGKVFEQLFVSTVNELPLTVRWVWVGLISTCDEDGIVDATPESIARRLNIPLDEVRDALTVLSQPDPNSRSTAEDGRRIVPIRPTYGWKIVNYTKYRQMRSQQDRREYHRDYKRNERAGLPKGERGRNRQHSSTVSTKAKAVSKSSISMDVTAAFEDRWARYPRKEGRKKALKNFAANIRNAEDLQRFDRALDNYLRKIAAESITAKYIKHGSTFFNEEWEDFVDWQPPTAQAARPEGRSGVVL